MRAATPSATTSLIPANTTATSPPMPSVCRTPHRTSRCPAASASRTPPRPISRTKRRIASRVTTSGAPDVVTRLAIRRFVLLIGLGGVLDALAAGHLEVRWGVLQTLGMGGLVAVVFAGMSDVVALGVAALIVVTHYGPGNN